VNEKPAAARPRYEQTLLEPGPKQENERRRSAKRQPIRHIWAAGELLTVLADFPFN
jgi:hypothetical protein